MVCCPGTGAPESVRPRSGTVKRSVPSSLTPPLRALPSRPHVPARACPAPSARPRSALPLLRCRPQRPSAAPWSSASSLHGLVRHTAAGAAPRSLRWHLWPWGGLRQVRRVEAAKGWPGMRRGAATPRAAGRGLIWLPCGGLFETAPRRTFAWGRRPSGGAVRTTHRGSREDPIVTSPSHGLVSLGSDPTDSPPLEALSSREWLPPETSRF